MRYRNLAYLFGVVLVAAVTATARAGDSDGDGLDDDVEDALLKEHRPILIYEQDEVHWPVSILDLVQHSRLRWNTNPDGFDYDWLIDVYSEAQLAADPRLIFHGGDVIAEQSSSVLEHPTRNEYYLDINDDWRGGIYPEQDGSAHRGMYGHVVPCDDLILIQYWQLFSHDVAGCADDCGDHEGDWLWIDVYVESTWPYSLRKLVYHHHGDKNCPPTELTGSSLPSDGIPLCYIEEGAHEWWPVASEGGECTFVGVCDNPSHSGGGIHYQVPSVPNLGEWLAPRPGNFEAELLLLYNGRWGGWGSVCFGYWFEPPDSPIHQFFPRPVKCTPEWSPLEAGIDGTVLSLAVFDDDGDGPHRPALYVGGVFELAGGVGANNIARWDGTTWSPLGTGTDNVVRALAVFDDGSGPALYAAGDFQDAGGVYVGHIARWDGAGWSPLGSGVMLGKFASVKALFVSGSSLYATGEFNEYKGGDLWLHYIGRWDGSAWSPLDHGLGGDPGPDALAKFDGLCAAGEFSVAGDREARRIARWDGAQWSPLGAGVDVTVLSLAVFDDGRGSALYTGEVASGSGKVSYIHRWDGAEWSSWGAVAGATAGANSKIAALSVFGDGSNRALYAGGNFTTAGGVSANCIARFCLCGTSWFPLGTGMNSDVLALAEFDDGSGPAVYAGGSFTTAGGVSANGIARWGCACRPDCTHDGKLNINDFICFQSEWRKKSPYGDYNHDGKWNINDFIAFQADFRKGCP